LLRWCSRTSPELAHVRYSGSILQHPKTGEVDFAVGRTGQFTVNSTRTQVNVRVLTILGAREMVVGPERGFAFSLVVRGVPTGDLADDKVISLPGTWKITGTAKRGGRTLYVAEKYTPPAPPPPPKKTAEQLEAERKKTEEAEAALAAARAAERKRAREATEEQERKRLAREQATRIARDEKPAAAYLAATKRIYDRGERERGVRRLKEIIRDYPGTKAAAEAATLLKEWDAK
jgi:hypothetical protein